MMKLEDEQDNGNDAGDKQDAAETTNDNKKKKKKKEGAGTVSKGFLNCGFCCFKFKEKSQISALEFKISNRQKKFGVDYLTLVEHKASQTALKQCLKDAMKDISDLQRVINEHYDKIDQKKEETERKIEEGPASKAQNKVEEGEKPKKKKRASTKNAVEEGETDAAETEPKESPEEPEVEKKKLTKKKSTKKKKSKEGDAA